MTNLKPTAAEVKENLSIKLSRFFGCTAAEASKDQLYKATAKKIILYGIDSRNPLP